MHQIEFNVFYLIRSVKKHLKTFIAINVAALLLSIIYSFIVPIRYEAKAIFYPFSPESSDPRIMMYEQAEFTVFGYSDQVERYTNLGKSNSIKYFLADKYNLYKRYKIDTESMKLANHLLVQHMNGDIMTFTKGENGAIKLTVLDADRDTAAMICNDVITLIDSLHASLLVEKNSKVTYVYYLQFQELNKSIQGLKDTIAKAIHSDDKYKAATIEMLQSQLNYSMEEYMKVKTKYELSKTLTNKQLKSLYLIEPAQATYKKAFPNRKLIVGGAFTISLMLTVIGFTIIEFVKDNKEKFVF